MDSSSSWDDIGISIVNVLEGPGGGRVVGAATMFEEEDDALDMYISLPGMVMWLGRGTCILTCRGRRVRLPVLKTHSLLESKHLIDNLVRICSRR